MTNFTACLLLTGSSAAIELIKPRGAEPAVAKIDFYKASKGEASGLVRRQQGSVPEALDNTAVCHQICIMLNLNLIDNRVARSTLRM